jgi:hypothetical protein
MYTAALNNYAEFLRSVSMRSEIKYTEASIAMFGSANKDIRSVSLVSPHRIEMTDEA